MARASVRMNSMTDHVLTDYLASEVFERISARDILVWMYIAEHGPEEYSTYDLARAVNGQQANISRGLNQLVSVGLLVPLTEPRKGKTAKYRAVFPKIEQKK